ncbi:Splicing factor U2af small subunit A (U2 auxiliary factor 35 kDa subunit A) (U2 small nuclear ribonucleoprotein auxiliary factor small subunit A) (U2 snRNP auxiliary factor small subunit A) (Zinc finger CCCH domain-containing protein 60) (OsC3H60) [Durusdinium trenchii]|uniref:C3H1-type domain-containing protein n=1 Tax=Durusdinium trenchii TaxID=1381693 RepID=A0ABP0JBC9_9DINO
MSQTLLLSHMYPNTPESLALANDEPWDDDMYDRAQAHLEAFYVEVFLELANYGEIEDLVVVDNLCDHMIGNVYVKYYHEEDAERALMKLTGEFMNLIQAEYTTVSDFREARCRAFHETRCNRGAYCNFMHIKHIPRAIKRRVVREMYDDHPEYLGQTEKDRDRDRGERGEAPPARQTSEERRAMIASWNAEKETWLE